MKQLVFFIVGGCFGVLGGIVIRQLRHMWSSTKHPMFDQAAPGALFDQAVPDARPVIEALCSGSGDCEYPDCWCPREGSVFDR